MWSPEKVCTRCPTLRQQWIRPLLGHGAGANSVGNRDMRRCLRASCVRAHACDEQLAGPVLAMVVADC